jgi:hypothetical protein
MRNIYKISVGKPEKENTGVDRMILKYILNRYGVRVWTGFNRQDFCKHGNEASNSIRAGNF